MKRALAFLAAVAIGAAARAEALEDSWWAGGSSGTWGGANWFYTMRHSNLEFTEGKTAYFTNETSVIDLGGRTFDVYTMRNPLADGARVSVTVTNGTLSLRLASDSSDGDDVLNFKNFDLVAGAGANIVNANETRGYRFSNNAHVVVGAGATLTETTSETSSSLYSIIGMGSASTSNSLTVAGTATFQRRLYIDGDNSATASPTGIVRVVSGGVLNANDSLRIGVNYASDNGATSGYGLLEIEQGGTVNALNGMWMGGKWSDSKNLYALSELRVGGTLNVTGDIFFGEGSPDITVRKVTIDGGKVDLTGGIKLENNDRARSVSFDIKNGGEIALTSLQFDTWKGEHSYNFDGGTIKAKASFETPAPTEGIKTTVTVSEGGFVFDTQEYNVIFRQGIYYGSGTFTKKGSGYFEFNYVPTFPGAIDVSEGTVGLAGSSAKFPGAITVRSGAAFKKTVEFASEQDASFTLEAGATLQPYQSSASAAPTVIQAQSFTLPATGTVTIRLGDDGANTAPAGAHPLVTILGEGVFTQADVAKFVCMSNDAVKSLALSADGKSIVLNVGTPDVCVWTGTAGDGLFSSPANWAGGVKPTVGGATPIVFATSGGVADNDIGTLSPAWIEFRSGSGVTSITGSAFTGIAAITNLSTSAMTFNAPVTFAGTYSVVKSGAVVFAGGATATYPDAAQRTSSSSDLNRTLSGSFTFTGDWSVPDLGTADKPWIIPSGSEVHGKLLTGTQTNRKRILRIENNASAHFTVMTNGWSIGDIDVNGTLEVDGEVVVKTLSGKDGWSNFGTSGNTGTVKAGKFAKVDSSYVYSRIPNLVVGAGGIGSIVKDWSWRFYSNATVKTGDSDFEFLGVYNSGSTSDWGVFLASGVTLTVDVGEGRTVTMGAGVYGDGGAGAVRKTGAGTLVMSNTHNGQSGFTKSYTNGTTVEGGTLKVLPNGMPASGTVTFHGGTTLQLPAAGSGSVALGTALAVSGEGDVFLKLGEGTETIAEGTYSLFTASVSEAVLGRLRLVNPTAGGAMYRIGCYGSGTTVLYVGDPVPETAGECVWIGAAGDGLFSSAANWAGRRRPQDVGASAVLRFNTVGGNIENDVEGLSVASINFGKLVPFVKLCGKPISGVSKIANSGTTHHEIALAVTCASGTPDLAATSDNYIVYSGGLTAGTLATGSKRWTGKITMTDTGDFTAANGDNTSGDGTVLAIPKVQLNNFTINSGTAVKANQWIISGNMRNNNSKKPTDWWSYLTWSMSGKFRVGEIKTGGDCRLYTSDQTAPGIFIVDGISHSDSRSENKYNGTTRYMYVYLHPRAASSSANWAIGANGLAFGTNTSCEYYIESGKTANMASFADWHIANNPRASGALALAVFGTLNLDTSHYTTGEEEGDVPTGHTVTLDGYLRNGGTINVAGSGKFVINRTTTDNTTGAVNVKDTATLAINAGMKYFGPVNLNGASSFLAPQANIGTAQIGGALTLNSGTSLIVSNLTAGTTAVSVGSVTVKGAMLLVEGETPLADGDYTILTAGSDLAASVAGNFSLGGSAVAGKAASLSVDGANLVLTVAGEGLPASPFHVWTGAGADANFSTAANWQSGAAPQAGDGKGIFFQSSTGTLVNDIPGLTPPWITFGAGIGETTIAGVNGFTDILAVTNLSTAANATFEVPVAYAAGRTIEVDHRAEYNNDNATYSREKGAVVFAGGVTGEEIRSYQSNGLKSGPHNVYAGQYVRTSNTTFQATLGGSNWRSAIYPGSSLTVKSSTKTGELDIGAGGAFTTGVATITSDSGLNALVYRMGEDSEVVVTERVETPGTGDRMMWRSGSKKAVFKVNGFLQSMTGNWLYLADNNIDEQYGVFYVGPDGFNFSSSSAGGSFALGRDNAASRNTLRPWTNDFTVATRGTREKDFVFTWNNTICTDDENGIGRKITFNAIPQFARGSQGSVTTISGSGTFEMNSAVVNSAADCVEHIVVTNTATLAFGNTSACLTRGPMTMAAGTTLAVPGGVYGASVTLGSTLSVVGDGKVKLVIGDGSELAAGDYGVCVVTGGITAEDAAASFALQNATAGVAEFYVVNGAEVRLSVGGKRLSIVWTGAGDGVHFNNADNWSPAFVPENGSELVFPSGSGALVNDISGFAPKAITFGAGIGETTISGNAISGVLAVTNLSESVQTFSNEVAFADVYRAYCASDTGFVKFPGGATASYPDASLRTTTGTIASRTLDGNFTFTADWTIGNVGNDNYPWIVASGANVTGKALTGTEERQMFHVDEGGYACFTTVAVGKTKGNISVNGFLEATESISVGVSGQHAAFGKSGDTGTVKAPVIKKVDGYSVYCYIPNLIAGSGGVGAAHKDYVWQFQQDTTIVATNDFEFLGVYNSGNANDWGLGFNGHTVTMNVPEGLTVTFGVGENENAGILRKTGAGTLVMSDTFDGQSGFVKAYTGGTTVEGGTLKVLANGMPASGTVTFHAGTTLAVPGDAVVALGTALAFAGEGTVGLVIGDGSTLADGDYPVISTTATLPEGFAAKFALQNPTESAVIFYSTDGKTLRLAVGNASYTGPKVWTGAAGDGKLATAGNWLGESVPAADDDIFIDAISAGTIDNDLGIAVKSITFKATTAPVTITGNAFTGVAAITNLSTAVMTLSNQVSFASTYLVHCESTTGFVDFAGGATATYPDAAITSDNLASHTLCGDITFTQNWTIPDQASGKPFVIPAGANVKGKTVAANAYNNANYHLRIENGGTGTFETIAVDGKFVFLLQEGGKLVATGDVTLGGADKRDFGYYNAANSGVLEAHGIYKSVTGNGLIYHYMRNMRVGAGGFGMYRKDYSIQFCADSKLTATDDLAIHQPVSGDGPKDGDWGLQLNGKTFTIDTAGHTVTFDSAIHGSAGKIVKEGEGELIMQSRKKIHNNTEVKGGTLTMKLTAAAGNGPISVASGATLRVDSASVTLPGALTMAGGSTLEVPQVASGATPVTVGTTFAKTGDGAVSIKLGDGSTLADGDYPVAKATTLIDCDIATSFALANNPLEENVMFYSPDGKTLRVMVGENAYTGPCVWTGEGNGYSFSDSANWLMGKRPDTDGCDIVLSVKQPSGLVNDLGALSPASIAIAAGSAMLGINGDAISGLGNVVNHSSEQVLFYTPVQFATTYNVVQNGKVRFLGGATATHPDVSLRTTTSTANTRTLYGDFTFTEDWTIEGIGTGNDYPWIVPSGTTVRGKLLTGTQNNHKRILRIDNGGYALFTTVTNGWDRGDIDIDGTLEVTGEMIIRTDPAAKGTASKFGRSGNTGTVKAWRIAKCEHCTAQSFIPNLVVGAGGLGAVEKDYSFLFDVDTTVTATDSFECHGVKHGSNFHDWGLNISSGKTVTFNVGEGMTVTCGVGVQGAGSIRKTGAGTLLMTDTYNGSTGFTKTYTGTTTVAEGTLRFAAGQLGTGAVTVSDGGRLEVAPGTTLSNALTVNDGGELAITGSGTATLSGAVTLNEGGIVGLKFTDAGESPKFAFTSAPTLSGDVFVKIETAGGVLPRNCAGKWLVAMGVGELDVSKLKFDDDIALRPTWVADGDHPFVVEDGNLYLKVKKTGLSLTVR